MASDLMSCLVEKIIRGIFGQVNFSKHPKLSLLLENPARTS